MDPEVVSAREILMSFVTRAFTTSPPAAPLARQRLACHQLSASVLSGLLWGDKPLPAQQRQVSPAKLIPVSAKAHGIAKSICHTAASAVDKIGLHITMEKRCDKIYINKSLSDMYVYPELKNGRALVGIISKAQRMSAVGEASLQHHQYEPRTPFHNMAHGTSDNSDYNRKLSLSWPHV